MVLPNTSMWMIRAGQDGSFIHQFLNEGMADLGWSVGPIHPTNTNDNIRHRVREAYPNENTGALPNIVGMIRRFCCEVLVGDAFVTYDPRLKMYHIGVVRSDANDQVFHWVDQDTGDTLKDERRYVRAVDWVSTLSRDSLSKSTQNALNPQLSHFRISDQASEEIRRLCT